MARSSKSRLPEGDDGRTIVSMNAEGMPWYRPEAPGDRPPDPGTGGGLSPEERRMVVWGAVRTGLLIFAVFALAFLLFLLFSDYVWFGN